MTDHQPPQAEDFNWVRARTACSANQIYDSLIVLVKAAVEERNKTERTMRGGRFAIEDHTGGTQKKFTIGDTASSTPNQRRATDIDVAGDEIHIAVSDGEQLIVLPDPYR